MCLSLAPPTWSRLRIQNLRLGDAGDYICRAKNTRGQVEMKATLEVTREPKIVEAPQDQQVYIGNTMKMKCIADGKY